MAQRSFTLFILLGLLYWLPSCSSSNAEGETEEDANKNKLSGSWTTGTNSYVKRDDVDITDEYDEFVIRFTTSNAYTVQKDPNNVFYPTGIWKFAPGTFSQIILNNSDTPVSLTYEGENMIMLSFTVSGNIPVGERLDGISGNYIFRLTRK